MKLEQTKLPQKEAELQAEMEAVENAQRVIRNTEQQVIQVRADVKVEMKQLAKKLNEVQQQVKEESQKLADREEDFNKMQEDYENKIRELQATLGIETQVIIEFLIENKVN